MRACCGNERKTFFFSSAEEKFTLISCSGLERTQSLFPPLRQAETILLDICLFQKRKFFLFFLFCKKNVMCVFKRTWILYGDCCGWAAVRLARVVSEALASRSPDADADAPPLDAADAAPGTAATPPLLPTAPATPLLAPLAAGPPPPPPPVVAVVSCMRAGGIVSLKNSSCMRNRMGSSMSMYSLCCSW